MKKILAIAWKDVLLTFRDQAALTIMLATPLALTMVIAFAFGGLGSGGSGFSQISMAIVNHDSGQFGQIMVDVFSGQDLAELIKPTILSDDSAARARVDDDKAAAAVIIPAGFSDATLARQPSVIEVYRNPTRPVSAGVVRGIVDQVIGRITAGTVGGQVAITQLAASGLISPLQAMAQGAEIGERAAKQASSARLISLNSETASQSNSADFDWLTYMAPSLAILFLMFAVTNGGRSLLAERDGGTLPRLLATPTPAAHILGGKVGGIFATGVAQMAILILASSLLFRVRWGEPVAVALLTLALVAAATGWGALLAAFARTTTEAGMLGSMLSLVFAISAGNLVPRTLLPSWLRTISLATPNAWGLEGFGALTAGKGLSDVITLILGLLVMAAVLFVAATIAFRRQYAR
jgi:ABC-2 type transport system permease protein